MAEKPGFVATLNGYRYSLEPGDGTHYEFSIYDCSNHNGTIRGVNDGRDYVGLALHCPGGGSYEVRRDQLLKPSDHFCYYLKGHMQADIYTVRCIVLAASVLIKEPLNVQGAMMNMIEGLEKL